MAVTQSHQSALVNLAAVRARVYAYFDPPPDITISEWAIRNRVLPKGTTSRPGPFKPEKFQIEMMDVILDPLVHEVVIQKSTQVGYSDAVVNNICGYFIDADPKPIMLVQPTIENAKDYGKKRITPMIENCPALREKIKPPTTRRAGNTLALKEFPGGFLKLTGANSGAGLRSDPVPVVLFDEVDGYPIDVDGEGDPIAIGTRRTDQFGDYKIVKGSTPAKPKGISPIERDFLRSDMRRFHVLCPFCGFKQALRWREQAPPIGNGTYRLFYAVNADGQVDPASVAYICAGCEKKIPERFKQQMLNSGSWVAQFPEREVVGFHINALYSPWRENWGALAQEWHEANKEGNPEKLKAFINLRLGETWEEQGDSMEALTLKGRLEAYKAEIPDGVGMLTAAVDVQGDRLECVVKGWGDKEESWLIAYQQLFGDPGQEQVWSELDEFLLSTWETASGQKVKITCTMIDSGGLHTDSVYRFCRVRANRRIFCLKGSSEAGKEILGKMSTNNQYRVRLWLIGTDTAKDRIFARMKIPGPGPAYMHLPDFIEDEYLAQLTAEKAVRRYRRGKGTIREYIKTRARNEALDLEVYALAALYVLGQATIRKLGDLAAALRLPPAGGPDGAPGGQSGASGGSPGRPGGGSSWVNGWR
jgi:phage terminase large subunit GpA-like protein